MGGVHRIGGYNDDRRIDEIEIGNLDDFSKIHAEMRKQYDLAFQAHTDTGCLAVPLVTVLADTVVTLSNNPFERQI